jgi:hypothetical protein
MSVWRTFLNMKNQGRRTANEPANSQGYTVRIHACADQNQKNRSLLQGRREVRRGAEIAAAVLFLVAFIEHAKDKTFSPYPFVCLSVLLFFCGTFLASSHECNAKEFLENKVAQLEKRLTDVPHLCVIQRGFYADTRTLSEQLGSIVRPVAEVSCLHVKFKNNPTLSIESSIARNILEEVEFVDESGHLLCAFLGRWGIQRNSVTPRTKSSTSIGNDRFWNRTRKRVRHCV